MNRTAPSPETVQNMEMFINMQMAALSSAAPEQPAREQRTPAPAIRSDRRRWAMLIRRVYQADPLLCPRCGGTMKIIAFIEARQGRIIEKILRHCGLWQAPSSRGPPRTKRPPQPGDQARDPDSRLTYEVDADFVDYARRERLEQPELPLEF